MKVYNFFSSINFNYFEHLENLLITLKRFKDPDAKYNYIIAIDSDNIQKYKNKLEFLNSQNFNIIIYSSQIYANRINPHKGKYLYYLKCLLPSVCSGFDKILFLDTDMLILQPGIEKFYDTDITNYYVAACWDQMDIVTDKQKPMSKTKTYFNSGVMLFNLKKIKEDGLDKKMEEYLLKWPEELKDSWLHDQTLNNYVYRNKVLMCSPIYNNTLSVANKDNFFKYKTYYKLFGYKDPWDSIKDTVILHFAATKPWLNVVQGKQKLIYYQKIRELYLNVLNKNKKSNVKQYYFFSSLRPNYLSQLRNLLNSLKKYKSQNSKYTYIVAIDDDNVQHYKQNLQYLQNWDFNVIVYSSKIYKNKINPPQKQYDTYIRCLLPIVCKDIDKILYLDCDILALREGIEEFYDTDISDYYVYAVSDPPIDSIYGTEDKQALINYQKLNVGTGKYFNAGVMLLNIKKIKEDGLDKKFEQYLKKWPEQIQPILYDQTLYNYILKDGVRFCSLIYNNMLFNINLGTKVVNENLYKRYGYQNPLDSLKDTVLIHFAGAKPWMVMDKDFYDRLVYKQEMYDFYEKISKTL